MELVDTRDLKSLAPLSMRVRVPPVLPSCGHTDHYDKEPIINKNMHNEIYIYTHRGELVNIKNRWKA